MVGLAVIRVGGKSAAFKELASGNITKEATIKSFLFGVFVPFRGRTSEQ